MSIFFAHVGSIDTAAVGMNYVPNQDPFGSNVRQATFSISEGYIFKDAVPLGLNTWVWDTAANWRASGQVFEGSSDIKAIFNKSWAGFGLGGFTIDSGAERTLSLAVRPDENVGDLYIELYNKKGNSMGRQSLGWYVPSGALVANQWQTISIPVQNLLGSSTSATITALAISTTNPGTVYVDSIQFNNRSSAHDPWFYHVPETPEVPVYVPPPFNPFATSTALKLPYSLSFSPNFNDDWFSPRGFFKQDYDSFYLGPAKGDNDALAYVRGGKMWGDYQVSAKVAWGSASVFALVARMQDEGNYASCSYSSSGDTIQMYVVKDGVSTMVTQSDKLHYADYSGGAVQTGASVQGKTLTCSLDGQQILSQNIADMASQGTAGMEAWDQDGSRTAHQIETFKVIPLVGE